MGSSPRTEVSIRDKESDSRHVKRAIELAEMGRGLVSPSPMVGSVITDINGEVVGEGSYFFDDVVHAEVVALREAGAAAKGGTAFVSLEPHGHHGRTRPCTEALVEAGIKRVVAPIEDPNPLVSGKGFEYLKANGVEVDVGLHADLAERQNEAFIVWHREKRPFVHVKLASTLDGRIATKTGESQWITGAEARSKVHQLRSQSDAILVGSRTVIADNPSLTDRSEQKRRRDLVRVVLKGRTDLPSDSKIFDGTFPTLVFGSDAADRPGIESIDAESGNIKEVLSELYDRDLQNLLIEGGGEVAGSFFDAGLVDRVTYFIAPKIVGGRRAVPSVGGEGVERLIDCHSLENVEIECYGADIEITGVIAGR